MFIFINLPQTMKPERIGLWGEQLPEWGLEIQAITREFQFDSFADSVTFLQFLDKLTENVDVTPDVAIRGTRVTVRIAREGDLPLRESDFQIAKDLQEAAE